MFDNHPLTIISADGTAVEPVSIEYFQMGPAERVSRLMLICSPNSCDCMRWTDSLIDSPSTMSSSPQIKAQPGPHSGLVSPNACSQSNGSSHTTSQTTEPSSSTSLRAQPSRRRNRPVRLLRRCLRRPYGPVWISRRRRSATIWI